MCGPSHPSVPVAETMPATYVLPPPLLHCLPRFPLGFVLFCGRGRLLHRVCPTWRIACFAAASSACIWFAVLAAYVSFHRPPSHTRRRRRPSSPCRPRLLSTAKSSSIASIEPGLEVLQASCPPTRRHAPDSVRLVSARSRRLGHARPVGRKSAYQHTSGPKSLFGVGTCLHI